MGINREFALNVNPDLRDSYLLLARIKERLHTISQQQEAQGYNIRKDSLTRLYALFREVSEALINLENGVQYLKTPQQLEEEYNNLMDALDNQKNEV